MCRSSPVVSWLRGGRERGERPQHIEGRTSTRSQGGLGKEEYRGRISENSRRRGHTSTVKQLMRVFP